MSYVIAAIEITASFLLTFYLLFIYGNLRKQHLLVTVSVLIAWFFSFAIVVLLPIDVSSVLGIFWRILYWTSQLLTWLILPLMQSYIRAGQFTVLKGLYGALLDNAIYYGIYLLLVMAFFIYIVVQPDVSLDFAHLKVIAITASNTWGLCLLVPLLGYGLVEVPHSLWRSSTSGYNLRSSYFQLAKLDREKLEAEEQLEDLIHIVNNVEQVVKDSEFWTHVKVIIAKIPSEFWKLTISQKASDRNMGEFPTEKALVQLHCNVIRAVQNFKRTQAQWTLLLQYIWHLEDIAVNVQSPVHQFQRSFSPKPKPISKGIATVQWYWYCCLQGPVQRLSAILLALLSGFLVWSELTFFSTSPVLSVYALLANVLTADHNYLSLEIFSLFSIAYLCTCAYYTIFKIRVFNFYYLAPHHLTDPYSLLFSGKLLCRMTAPLCLNYLGLIHLDSHITQHPGIQETAYTHIMGHLDVLPFISNGFNLYFPSAILALCIGTVFGLGSRVLSYCGFQQFLENESITTDLVQEGHQLSIAEKRKWLRNLSSHQKHSQSSASGQTSPARLKTSDSVHLQLLSHKKTPSYMDSPAQGIFDDI